MANKVTVVKEGGEAQVFDGLATVKDAAAKVNALDCTAAINGEPAEMSDLLDDYSFVSFARKDKAG